MKKIKSFGTKPLCGNLYFIIFCSLSNRFCLFLNLLLLNWFFFLICIFKIALISLSINTLINDSFVSQNHCYNWKMNHGIPQQETFKEGFLPKLLFRFFECYFLACVVTLPLFVCIFLESLFILNFNIKFNLTHFRAK